MSKFLDTGILEGVENAYRYIIEVSNDESNWYFMVYEGPSGPAIGYDTKQNQPNAIEASKALLEKIKKTTPSDFNEVIYYEDFDSKITYGCKNGECFYKEEIEESH